ncbi:MAG: NAD-dependent epimerase/dehydratase family protein [Desulfuromonadales bacterium]|nr:NAD-dependent epimerase/dehydratase family protein [Desulfuromonadales bacterium]
MKILITGICGFVGSTLAKAWLAAEPGLTLYGIDNLCRPGSEMNRLELQRLGIKLVHGDLRQASDLEGLPRADWVVDAAANPSVLAGIDGQSSSRQLIEHNLFSTINLLEYCKCHHAGFILLSTSRVYSAAVLSAIPVQICENRFVLAPQASHPIGLTSAGIGEEFSTASPLSLYGGSKLASEVLSLEYGAAYDFPVWINRCGVLVGAGQFGRPDQGIVAYWLHAWRQRQPLTYLGFGGQGHQVRDVLHPHDLLSLLRQQIAAETSPGPRIFNLGGGAGQSFSLAELSRWCEARFGSHVVGADHLQRRYDVPWLVMDSSLAGRVWNWQPRISLHDLLEEIALHAEEHPDWLAQSAMR